MLHHRYHVLYDSSYAVAILTCIWLLTATRLTPGLLSTYSHQGDTMRTLGHTSATPSTPPPIPETLQEHYQQTSELEQLKK